MREGPGGYTSLRLACPEEGLTSVCTHPLTHSRQCEGNLTIPNKMHDLPCWYIIPSRCTTGEWKRTAIVAARVRVYWFPFSWGSVSTHTHSLHLQLHRPPWACEAAGCDANGTGWFANDTSSSISVVATGTGPILQILRKYQSDGGWRVNKGGWAVRSTEMRLHNSANLIKCAPSEPIAVSMADILSLFWVDRDGLCH